MSKNWREYRKLRLKKYRSERQLFTVEGVRLCREALASDWKIEAGFCSQHFSRHPEYENFKYLFQQREVKPQILSDTNFKLLANTDNPQGILLVIRMPEGQTGPEDFRRIEKFGVILEGIRDPGNLGTIIRTADWFGVQLLIALPDTVDFYNPKVVRASMGSFLRVPFMEQDNLAKTVATLRYGGCQILGSAAQKGALLEQLKVKPPVVLILGGEAEGISPQLEELADDIVNIPKFGQSESLNVAVAGGILMHHLAGRIFGETKC